MKPEDTSFLTKKRPGFRGSVSTTIIVVQLVVVLVVMAVNGELTYIQDEKRLNESLRQREGQLLRRLPSSLVMPLWNLDGASVDLTVTTEMMDTDVQAIVVTSISGISGKIRDDKGAVAAWTQKDGLRLSTSSYHRLSSEITYKGKAIGTVVIFLSDQSIKNALRASLLQTYFTAGIVIVLLSLSTFIISRFFVARPLKLVDQALVRIAGGDLSITVSFRSRNEIGVLARTFNIMAEKLKRTMEDLRRSEEKYRGIFENAIEGFFQSSLEGQFLIVNPTMAVLLGYDSPADLMESIVDIRRQLYVRPEDRDELIAATLKEGTVIGRTVQLRRKDERTIWVFINDRLVRDGARKPLYIEGSVYDITERFQADERIKDLARFADENPNPLMRVSPDGSMLYQNHASRALLPSWTGEQASRIPSEQIPELHKAWTSGEKRKIEARDGKSIIELAIVPILSRGYINLYGRDVTEEQSLAEKLAQSQKMEAVGRLAGGISHDFNNLLMVIIGYCGLVQEELIEGSPVRAKVDEIAEAAERAATLTTKLLAFSRKQVLMPRVINPNNLVKEVEKILVRLVGEDIEIRTFLQPEAGNIKADPGQIEQVLMNLVVNARDAMPDGGKLTIETSNRVLDDEYALEHPDVLPGEYVRITVSDTGQGMNREVLSHIFEPFFTTKAQGKGTGLGLATVYGIVKQSEGHITCYSELNKGTTFTIFFPRAGEASDRTAAPIEKIATLRGSETILVVEDEERVRHFTQTLLKKNGYTVIAASGGKEALAIVESQKCEVALLVTDVVMPQMGGKELAQRLTLVCPRAKVLFVSGYSENVIAHQGVLDAGIEFFQKPFKAQEFLAKIREILDRQ
jgi:PAS domain S-box-containing protein